MTLIEVVEKLGLHVMTSKDVGDTEVTGGYTCDLLSSVMANSKTGNLWITMQTHQNVIAVAKLKDLAGIVFVNGRQPDKETTQKADEEYITVLGTDESAFNISGKLYQLLEKQ
ncbi:MAG: serine kinase [candidate division Zixibacteria bacterium]|nr:serine kinase [candidate division Zixibacteria bacterium]